MIVIDASALLDALLDPESVPQVVEAFLDPENAVIAPALIDLEIAQVLRRLVRAGELQPDRGKASLIRLTQLPLGRIAHTTHLLRIWELRNNLTAYDAAYVSIAEHYQSPLVTRDRKYLPAHGHNAEIIVL